MKRPSRKSPKRKSPKALTTRSKASRASKPAKAAKSARAVRPARAAKPAGAVEPGRAAKPVRPARRAKAQSPRRPAEREGDAAFRSNGPLPEGDRQLSDPVEAAQEDARALPEQALFDRDDSGRDDDLAEMLGEEFVRSVTSGEEQGVELRDEAVPEEEGGPFVETSGAKEFANTADDSEIEPLPTVRAPRTRLLR